VTGTKSQDGEVVVDQLRRIGGEGGPRNSVAGSQVAANTGNALLIPTKDKGRGKRPGIWLAECGRNPRDDEKGLAQQPAAMSIL
jgi:hypothetical protein